MDAGGQAEGADDERAEAGAALSVSIDVPWGLHALRFGVCGLGVEEEARDEGRCDPAPTRRGQERVLIMPVIGAAMRGWARRTVLKTAPCYEGRGMITYVGAELESIESIKWMVLRMSSTLERSVSGVERVEFQPRATHTE